MKVDVTYGIATIAVERGLNGTVTEIDGLIVAGDASNAVVLVSIGTSNDYMEVIAVLAVVDSV